MDVRLIRSTPRFAVVCAISTCVLFACNGFETREQQEGVRAITAEDLIEFNQRKLMNQKFLVDSLVSEWEWKGAPDYKLFESGLHLIIRDEASLSNLTAIKADSARWNVDVRLVDSTMIMHWAASAPLVFHRQRSGWPTGFHELAENLSIGDSAECLMPAYLAWGLTGWAPYVPQDATLLIRIRVLGENSGLNVTENQANWLQVISDFESGSFGPDPQWCGDPTLLGSACLAWGDRSSRSSKMGLSAGTSVSLRMRTQILHESNNVEDLGWRSWQFEWGDEGQCLPFIEELMLADSRFKRWECWCSAEKAFGQLGFPEAGIYSGDVVGFQWELSEVGSKTAI